MIQSSTPQRSVSKETGGFKTLWIGTLILLMGAFLRLAAFDETLILEDQSAILDAAFQVAHWRYFPIIGMKSSAGVMQTGIVPLLAAVPLFFVKRIIAVQWFMSVLDLLALAWLHRAVHKTFGNRAAGIAALLYATAPWVILYSRTIWYQALVAPFATVTFASILWLLADSKSKPGLLALGMVSTTMMSMVHLAAAPWGLLLFIFMVVLAQRRRLWRSFWWGIGASGALALPYVVYLVHSSFADIAFLLKTGAESQGLNTTAYRLSAELISGAMIVANAHGDLWDRSVIPWDSASGIVLAVLGVALLWAGYQIVANRMLRPLLLFTVVWLLGVPALFLRSNIHLQHFYLMMIFPAPFVLVAACIEACGASRSHAIPSKLRRMIGDVTAALLVLIALWWASLWVTRIQLEALGLLERPTRGWLMDRTAEVITGYLREQPDNQMIVLAQFEGEMSAFEWLRGYAQTDAIRVVAADQGLLIPEGPVCYLLGPQVPVQALFPVSTTIHERPEMAIPANPPWPFFCGSGPVGRPAPLAEWENGLSLLQTEVTGEFRPGAQLDIVHTWAVHGTELGAYHFFNHLFVDGTFITQVDGQGIPYWYWRDGDKLVTVFSLSLPDDLPNGDYVLRTGMYTWPGLQRVLRVSGEDGYNAYASQFP
jgi:hypothetical protein